MSPGWFFFQVAVSALIELSLTFRYQRLRLRGFVAQFQSDLLAIVHREDRYAITNSGDRWPHSPDKSSPTEALRTTPALGVRQAISSLHRAIW